MNVSEAVARIMDFDEEAMLFARKPWSPHAECAVALVDDDEEGEAIHLRMIALGLTYFLEVGIVRDLLEPSDYMATLTDEQKVSGVIFYAERDAWPQSLVGEGR